MLEEKRVQLCYAGATETANLPSSGSYIINVYIYIERERDIYIYIWLVNIMKKE